MLSLVGTVDIVTSDTTCMAINKHWNDMTSPSVDYGQGFAPNIQFRGCQRGSFPRPIHGLVKHILQLLPSKMKSCRRHRAVVTKPEGEHKLPNGSRSSLGRFLCSELKPPEWMPTREAKSQENFIARSCK